jgi:hypothetical protein
VQSSSAIQFAVAMLLLTSNTTATAIMSKLLSLNSIADTATIAAAVISFHGGGLFDQNQWGVLDAIWDLFDQQ